MGARMDLTSIQQRLELGERLKIKYKYPKETGNNNHGSPYGIRSDKLLDMSVELGRFYTNFRGDTPIWLEAAEVLEVSPDDGIYEDLAEA